MRPTILLIHGFPLDHSLWNANVEELGRVANVIAPDLLGFGEDGSTPGARTMESYAEQLYLLLDQHQVERVVLCGLSMGGYVALAFADRWPNRVEALILCNTRSTADTEEAKAGREATARDAVEKGSTIIARAMVPKVLGPTTRHDSPDRVAQVERMIARQDPQAIAAASRGMAHRPDRTHVLKALTVPVLIITGDADALMPLPTSQAMADAAHGAQLVVLSNAGHLSNLEAPEQFNATVKEFLNALPGA